MKRVHFIMALVGFIVVGSIQAEVLAAPPPEASQSGGEFFEDDAVVKVNEADSVSMGEFLKRKITCYLAPLDEDKREEDSILATISAGPNLPGPAMEYWVTGRHTYLVDDNGPVADYATIGAALRASVDGDTIFVCPGTYRELIDISTDVKLIGIAGADETVIDASTAGEGTVVSIGASATVQGFTITGAHNDEVCFYGGGIKIAGIPEGEADEIMRPVIQQNVITGNDPCRGGGGIHLQAGSAVGHGRMYTQAMIRNNVIAGNSLIGIEVSCDGANGSVIQNNVIADHRIGIVFTDDDMCDASSKVFNNVIYATDTPFTSSPYTAPGLNATFEYNAYYDYNTSTSHLSAVSATNVNVDPAFADMVRYRLDAASPLVNAGNPDLSHADVDGSRNDIGAYGGKQGVW